MSKKKKNKAQQLLKQKVLQSQLSAHEEHKALPESESKKMPALPEQEAIKSLPSHQIIGLKRTIISFVVITAIFGGIVVFNNRSPFFSDLGNDLYYTLRLNR